MAVRCALLPPLLCLPLLLLPLHAAPDPTDPPACTRVDAAVLVGDGLSWLRCQRLGLTAVPAAVAVSALDLSHNPLGSLGPGAMNGWSALEELLLINASVAAIDPGAIRPLVNLRRLDLSHNRLVLPSGLPPDALPLGLFNLDLSHNPLGRLPDAQFRGLTLLQVLRLNSGQLRTLGSRSLDGLPAVRTLYLYNNELRSLPELLRAGLDAMSRLEQLLLGGANGFNPWRCDCRLDWLRAWQRTRAAVRVTIRTNSGEFGPVCAEPPALAGRALFGADTPAFTCPVLAVSNRGPGGKPSPDSDGSGGRLGPRMLVTLAAVAGAWVAALCALVGAVCLRVGQACPRAADEEMEEPPTPPPPPTPELPSSLPQLQACVNAMEAEEEERMKEAAAAKEEPVSNGEAQPSISYV